jgi:hypothetical protein
MKTNALPDFRRHCECSAAIHGQGTGGDMDCRAALSMTEKEKQNSDFHRV